MNTRRVGWPALIVTATLLVGVLSISSNLLASADPGAAPPQPPASSGLGCVAVAVDNCTPTPSTTPTPRATATFTAQPTATATETAPPTATPEPPASATAAATYPNVPPTPTCTVPDWQVVAPLPRDVSYPAVDDDGTVIYSAGGFNSAVHDAIDQFLRYDPATNSWANLPGMPQRAYSAFAVFAEGRFYVFGGGVENVSFNTTRIFDPATNSWSLGASMPAARQQMAGGYHAGAIYLAGGLVFDDDPSTARAETWAYDIATNTWSPRAALPMPIGGPASELVDGQLYVIGGRAATGQSLDTLFAYDTANDRWTARTRMPAARNVPAAANVAGRIWVFGGGNPFNPTARTDIYDPSRDEWRPGPDQRVPRAFQGSAALEYLVVSAGGWNGWTSMNTTEIVYVGPSCGPTPTPVATLPPPSPTPLPSATCTAPAWQVMAPMPVDVSSPAVDSDGTYVYAAGGFRNSQHTNVNNLSRYDLASNTWISLRPMPDYASEVWGVYAEGRFFVFGGGSGIGPYTVYRHTRIYDIASDTWSYGAPMPGPRRRMAGAYFNGRIYITGGLSGDLNPETIQDQAWAYDIAANAWSTLAPVPIRLAGHVAEMVAGRLYLIGGRDGNAAMLNRVFAYDIATNTWSERSRMPTAREYPGSAVLDGRIWVYGGGFPYVPTAVTEIYDPLSDSWSLGPTQTVPRAQQGGTMVGAWAISVGGYNNVTSFNTTEVYNSSPKPCGPTPYPGK